MPYSVVLGPLVPAYQIVHSIGISGFQDLRLSTLLHVKADENDSFETLISKPTLLSVFSVFGQEIVIGFLSSLLVALGSLQQISPFMSKVIGS